MITTHGCTPHFIMTYVIIRLTPLLFLHVKRRPSIPFHLVRISITSAITIPSCEQLPQYLSLDSFGKLSHHQSSSLRAWITTSPWLTITSNDLEEVPVVGGATQSLHPRQGPHPGLDSCATTRTLTNPLVAIGPWIT